MKYPKIFAIGGLKNSGKDEAAKMLQYCTSVPKFLQWYWLYKLFYCTISPIYTITSFAKPLKKMLSALLNVSLEDFNDREFKENTYIYFPTYELTKTPKDGKTLTDNQFNKLLTAKDFSFLQEKYITIRQLLQCFGTEIMRSMFGDKLWIHATMQDTNLIISDLRFKVEAEEVWKREGKVIIIERNTCSTGKHASEREIKDLMYDKRSIVIRNNGTFKELFDNLRSAI